MAWQQEALLVVRVLIAVVLGALVSIILFILLAVPMKKRVQRRLTDNQAIDAHRPAQHSS